MNSITLSKLDHNQKSMHKALGISAYRKNWVHMTVMFELLSSNLLVQTLYDTPEEAPSNMCSVTGILEKAMDHITNLEEQVFLLLIFKDTHNSIADVLQDMDEKEIKGSTKDIGKVVSKFLNQLKAAPLMHAINVIKEVHHDYDRFMEKMLPESQSEKMEEVERAVENGNLEDLLNDALGKDREDDEDDD